MSSKIYSQVELLAKPKSGNHLVNKDYVDKLLDARIQKGVQAVAVEDLNVTYNPLDKTLTQNVGSALKIDGVALAQEDEILYAQGGDAKNHGIYVVTTLGTDGTPDSATASIGSSTGITNASVDKDTFVGKASPSTTKTYTFTYDGVSDNAWKLEGVIATLGDYGISIEGVPNDADTIAINYTAPVGGTPTVLTRAERMAKSSDLNSGMLIPIWKGDVYGDKIFQLITDADPMELDTTGIEFEKYGLMDGDLSKPVKLSMVGDGVKTEFDFNHGLKSEDVIVKVYVKDSKEECFFDVLVVDEDNIKIKSDVVLEASDEFVVVVSKK